MKSKKILIFGILILLIGVIAYISVQQSVLSFSQVSVGNNGKVYWTYFASATNPGETYRFLYKPNSYTIPNSGGKIVTPKQAISLAISPGQPQCIYTVHRMIKNYGFLGLYNLNYYLLNSPTRKVNIDIYAYGQQKTMDATTIDTLSYDINGGKLKVQTQGILGGKIPCPGISNVALIPFKDGTYGFFYKNDIDREFTSSLNTLTLLQTKSHLLSLIPQDSGFVGNFKTNPKFENNIVVGVAQFGFPTFTITADQDVFQSTTYIPPKLAKPKINWIHIPSKIRQGDSSSMIVSILNNGPNGLIDTKVTSDVLSVSPSSINTQLKNSANLNFNIVTNNKVACGKVIVKTCSSGQFSGENCDTDSANVCIVKPIEQVNGFCGDGVCQNSESKTTCPTDCNPITVNNTVPPSKCGPLISAPKILGGGTIIPNVFCIIGNFFKPLVYVFSFLLAFLSGIAAFFLSRDLIGNKKDKWIPPVVGLIIGVSLGYLSVVYFWLAVASVILLLIMKSIIPKIK